MELCPSYLQVYRLSMVWLCNFSKLIRDVGRVNNLNDLIKWKQNFTQLMIFNYIRIDVLRRNGKGIYTKTVVSVLFTFNKSVMQCNEHIENSLFVHIENKR